MNWKRFEVLMEFFIFGLVVGIVEDLIAVKVATGEPITWRIVGIIFLVAIPFAFIGEILVDRIDFIEIWKKILNNKKTSSLKRIHKFSDRKCVACEGGIPPLNKEVIDEYLVEVPGWQA